VWQEIQPLLRWRERSEYHDCFSGMGVFGIVLDEQLEAAAELAALLRRRAAAARKRIERTRAVVNDPARPRRIRIRDEGEH
jgi:hypothetical protein